MPFADVQALIADIAGTRSDANAGLADVTRTDAYYTDIVREQGLLHSEGPCDAAFVAVTAGDADYTQPAAAIRALMLLHDDRQLRPTLRRALEAGDRDWRARTGRPQAFTLQDEDSHVHRIVPIPAQSSSTIGASTPFSGPFPASALTFIYTDNATDVLPWDELWTALEVLGREFGRESDHYDATFAKTALQLASVLRTLVGRAA